MFNYLFYKILLNTELNVILSTYGGNSGKLKNVLQNNSQTKPII